VRLVHLHHRDAAVCAIPIRLLLDNGFQYIRTVHQTGEGGASTGVNQAQLHGVVYMSRVGVKGPLVPGYP
jgi:hypothetical protein